MVLERQLAIGALQLLVVGIPAKLPELRSNRLCSLLNSFTFLFWVVCHAHQRRAQKPLAHLVAAANLLGHVLVGQVVAIHRSQRLVQARIERFAHRWNRASPASCAESLPSASRSVPRRSATAAPNRCDLSASSKLSSTGRNCSTTLPAGIVAKLVPLALGPLACVFKLRLQPRQAVKQLVALRLQLLKFRRARGRFAARCCSVRFFRRRARRNLHRLRQGRLCFLFRHKSLPSPKRSTLPIFHDNSRG